MAKSRHSNNSGEFKTPPLWPEASQLRQSAGLENKIVTFPAGAAVKQSAAENAVNALVASESRRTSPIKCGQRIWLTYFFDGTGNNLDADLDLLKHSNIARLYRIHKATNVEEGIYRFYIPGVSTYFPEAGDMGASVRGSGFGALGEARLRNALEKFDKAISPHLAQANSPASTIEEINIAVFGFSRGAALARAFVNMMMETRCSLHENAWRLNQGKFPVYFRFMGLFDTVASVGNPMSRNNTDYYNPAFSDAVAMISERIDDYPDTSPRSLAFSPSGNAGADPAPGTHAGHDSWGGRMAIHETVMEVRHFIAAHEVRNSFPVDSISRMVNGKIYKPGHFYETVYPGSHSDVGGGYAPSEGGRAFLPTENFCLIPLRHMYEYALRKKVPLLPIVARINIDDFKTDEQLRDRYNHYLAAVGSSGSIGRDIRAHMRIYYAWRFHVIRRKQQGDRRDDILIESASRDFREKRIRAKIEIDRISKQEATAESSVNLLSGSNSWGKDYGARAIKDSSELVAARSRHHALRNERYRMTASRDAIPDMDNFGKSLEMYENQLMIDANSIRRAMRDAANDRASMAQRANLRPHYRGLVDAYEEEFEKKSGLKDQKIIEFFDHYIHDSLAGFARDATMPSDPRVVFAGGDQKLQIAQISDGAENETSYA